MDIIKKIYEWVKNIVFMGNNIAYIKEQLEKDAFNPKRIRCKRPCCSSLNVDLNIVDEYYGQYHYKCKDCGFEWEEFVKH